MSTISPRFVQGLEANVNYWRDKIDPWNTLPLDKVRLWNANIHRAVQLGLQLEETRESAAWLALMAAFLSERVGNWEAWIPVLRRLLRERANSLDPILKWRLLVRYGQLLRMNGLVLEAITVHEDAEKLALLLEDEELLGTVWLNLADNYFKAKQLKNAQNYGQKSLALFRKQGNTNNESIILLTLGHIAYAQGQFSLADEYLRAGIVVEKREKHDPVHLGRLYSLLATVFQAQKAYEEAVQIYQEALLVLASTASELDRTKTFISLGTAYFNMGRYEKAEQVFRQADTAVFRQSGDFFSQAVLMQNLGNVLSKLQQYDSALRYLDQAENLWQKAGEKLFAANTLFTKSEIYLAKQHLDAACDHIQRSIQMLEPFADHYLGKKWLQETKAFQSEHCSKEARSR